MRALAVHGLVLSRRAPGAKLLGRIIFTCDCHKAAVEANVYPLRCVKIKMLKELLVQSLGGLQVEVDI